MLFGLVMVAMAQETTPACLKAKLVGLDAVEPTEPDARVVLIAEVTNGCAGDVAGFAGTFRLANPEGAMSTARPVSVMDKLIARGRTEKIAWFLPVWGRPQDVWLGSVKVSDAKAEWIPTLVVFSAGSVVQADAGVAPDVAGLPGQLTHWRDE